VGGVLSPLLANIYLQELDRYMARYTALGDWERGKQRRQGKANFLYVRYADDFVVLCDGDREQAEALRQELYEYLKGELELNLSMEKTKVTHVSEGFEFLGYLIDRGIVGSGRWAPRIRIPAKAMEKVQVKLRTALSPRTCKDSVRTKILGVNRIIGGWCRYYQITTSPSKYFSKLNHVVYMLIADWLGRKYEMSTPRVMRAFKKGSTFGTGRTTLVIPSDFKAKRPRLRKIANPYTSENTSFQRENLDSLEGEWEGTEVRRGQADQKEVVYQRDKGLCGLCGSFIPWEEADLDHITPRAQFGGNTLENLWILHRKPCHQIKTKRDLQRGRRVR
jgi:RNA-directed DNA polymerase